MNYLLVSYCQIVYTVTRSANLLTVFASSIQTDRPEQTVPTLIRRRYARRLIVVCTDRHSSIDLTHISAGCKGLLQILGVRLFNNLKINVV